MAQPGAAAGTQQQQRFFPPAIPTTPTSSAASLDMEGVFYRLHSRLVHFVNRWTSPSSRVIMEMLLFVNAFALLFMLAWFHVKYVSRAETNCVTQVLKRELGYPFANSSQIPQVIKLQVSGIWSHLGMEDAKSSAKLTKVISAPETAHVVAANLIKVWLLDPVFVYSSERGFLMLDESTRQNFGIHEASIKLKTEEECFSEGLMQETERYLLDNFIGYDTVVLNAFGAVFESKGYLYSVHSRELLNVAHVHSAARSTLAFKFGAVATTLFLFFITTTLVHHTLRETQERMLKFTFDLQVYVRRGLGYRNLVLNHVIGSLVFVPIMVGMLFFLFEFFNDQLLAFMVLAVVWVCELFSVISLRTYQNVCVFPRLFFLYFCSFHLYFFLFPSGFSYMALTCCVVFLQHSMISFFVRHEMPALLSGRISAVRQRDVTGELLPEEVQSAAGASLAVRALTGTRTTTSSLESRSGSPEIVQPIAIRAATPIPVPAPTAAEIASATSSAFVARPTRRKRSTIHNEPGEGIMASNVSTISPVRDGVKTASALHQASGGASPPNLMLPPPVSVGPPSRWPLEEDDNSSQNSGWEIGGYG